MAQNFKRKIVTFAQNQLLKRGFVLARPMPFLGRQRDFNVVEYVDYVRISSLELVAHEISSRKIPGAVAELGVFKGDFAEKINQAFPKRDLYLFDTFEGFDARDVAYDRTKSYSTGTDEFQTSVDFVLSRMTTPERCIVKKGWFPDTAEGVEGPFAFVSLDADLYKPIYAGLEFFYPKLSRGGYIFVHDFNNENYLGAADALRQFCDEYKTSFFPLSDENGTAVISK